MDYGVIILSLVLICVCRYFICRILAVCVHRCLLWTMVTVGEFLSSPAFSVYLVRGDLLFAVWLNHAIKTRVSYY